MFPLDHQVVSIGIYTGLYGIYRQPSMEDELLCSAYATLMECQLNSLGNNNGESTATTCRLLCSLYATATTATTAFFGVYPFGR